MKPLAAAATALPPVAFRQDAGAAITALLRYAPHLLSGGAATLQLTGPFSKANRFATGLGSGTKQPASISSVGFSAGWLPSGWAIHKQKAASHC